MVNHCELSTIPLYLVGPTVLHVSGLIPLGVRRHIRTQARPARQPDEKICAMGVVEFRIRPAIGHQPCFLREALVHVYHSAAATLDPSKAPLGEPDAVGIALIEGTGSGLGVSGWGHHGGRIEPCRLSRVTDLEVLSKDLTGSHKILSSCISTAGNQPF